MINIFEIDYNDRKEIGKTGEYVSAIGLGTWSIRDYNRAFKTYSYALEHGIDNIDTAEMYDNGRAEEFVGKLIKYIGRENIFITTKMLPHHLISEDEVLKAAKTSLKRLNVNYVDLFLIHWPNPSLPIEIQIRNFEIVYLKGLSRYIGVSNFDLIDLGKALSYTRKADIVVNQVHYSVLERSIEKDLLPYCIRNNITIQAYTPLERGRVRHLRIIKELSRKYNKTPIQIALNYLISHSRVIAIPKAEKMEHLIEIIGSMGWRLSLEDLLYIEDNV